MSTTDKLAEALRDLLEEADDGIATSPFSRESARVALDAYEAEAKPAEPVAYWFRHINTEGAPTTEWEPVKARNPYMNTVADSVRELLAYRYKDKPCYEVMPLYAAPAAPAPVRLTDGECTCPAKDMPFGRCCKARLQVQAMADAIGRGLRTGCSKATLLRVANEAFDAAIEATKGGAA